MTEAPLVVCVRPFQTTDRPALEALWARVFPDDPPANAPGRMIDARVRLQPELLLVATTAATDDQIVGAVMGGFDGWRGWIYHLAVAPERRRHGIAKRLMRAVEDALARLGCAKVNLQVRATNAGVVAFYRALGYQVEDRISLGRRLDD